MRATYKSTLIAVAVLILIALTIAISAARSRPSNEEAAATMSSKGVTYGDCVVLESGPTCTATPEAPSFTTGLMQGEQDGPLGKTYNQVSQWAGYDDQHNQVIVGSGSEPNNPKQGAIYVDDIGDASGNSWTKVYDSPGQDGSLDLVAADGSELTVRAQDGATWTFDVFTGEFISVSPSPTSSAGQGWFEGSPGGDRAAPMLGALISACIVLPGGWPSGRRRRS